MRTSKSSTISTDTGASLVIFSKIRKPADGDPFQPMMRLILENVSLGSSPSLYSPSNDSYFSSNAFIILTRIADEFFFLRERKSNEVINESFSMIKDLSLFTPLPQLVLSQLPAFWQKSFESASLSSFPPREK